MEGAGTLRKQRSGLGVEELHGRSADHWHGSARFSLNVALGRRYRAVVTALSDVLDEGLRPRRHPPAARR